MRKQGKEPVQANRLDKVIFVVVIVTFSYLCFDIGTFSYSWSVCLLSYSLQTGHKVCCNCPINLLSKLCIVRQEMFHFQGKETSHPRKRKRASGGLEAAGSKAGEQQDEDLGSSLDLLPGDLGGSKGQEAVKKRKRKPKLETVAENVNKEEVEEEEGNEDLVEEEFEEGNNSEFEIEGEPQVGAEISHEEAMVKAVAYDALKVKFHDLQLFF